MYNQIAKEKFNNLQKEIGKRDIYVLGIESSCDDTCVSVVKNGRIILSNVVSSQIDIHKIYGGVVPEIASRNHIMNMDVVVQEALTIAGIEINNIDAIAVTYGAGLIGSLMVGVNYAKSLAFALNIPIIKVNHILGHISANYLLYPDLKPPFIGLIVSGGHTAIVKNTTYTTQSLISTTIDDAVGECYDKVAKCMGLKYPGGVQIDKLSAMGNKTIEFIHKKNQPKDYSLSYSGLKTAVINYLHKMEQGNQQINIPDVCKSFQVEAIDPLVDKVIRASINYKNKKIVVGGGVSANSYLREQLISKCKENNIEIYFPSLELCGDNGAMVACQGYYNIVENTGFADIGLVPDVTINLKFTNKIKR